jgi:hypothetical protein
MVTGMSSQVASGGGQSFAFGGGEELPGGSGGLLGFPAGLYSSCDGVPDHVVEVLGQDGRRLLDRHRRAVQPGGGQLR